MLYKYGKRASDFLGRFHDALVVRKAAIHRINRYLMVACVAAVSFPFLFQAESEQASEKAGERLG